MANIIKKKEIYHTALTLVCLCEGDGKQNPTMPHNLIKVRNTCRNSYTCLLVVCTVLTILGVDEVR